MKKLNPRNLSAQLSYRARGNPASALPNTAISNSFPGLEYDFRNVWRRMFVGLVLSENSNYVIAADNPDYAHVVHHRMLRVDDQDLVAVVKGPHMPGEDSTALWTKENPDAVAFLEWSNSLMKLWDKQGQKVVCFFTREEAPHDAPIPDESNMIALELEMRRVFLPSSDPDVPSTTINPKLLAPGDLTSGLCSPWQNDYRECACYYWAASRPDYVNVEPDASGGSRGDNWMQKQRTGEYVLDDRHDTRLHSYDDLFQAWEKLLEFQIAGRDGTTSIPVMDEKPVRKREE